MTRHDHAMWHHSKQIYTQHTHIGPQLSIPRRICKHTHDNPRLPCVSKHKAEIEMPLRVLRACQKYLCLHDVCIHKQYFVIVNSFTSFSFYYNLCFLNYLAVTRLFKMTWNYILEDCCFWNGTIFERNESSVPKWSKNNQIVEVKY